MVSIQNPADLTAPSKEFTFDSAYDSKSSTECIYNDICYPLVEVSWMWISNSDEYFIKNSAYLNETVFFIMHQALDTYYQGLNVWINLVFTEK